MNSTIALIYNNSLTSQSPQECVQVKAHMYILEKGPPTAYIFK